MRIIDKVKLTVSSDTLNEPKLIRLAEEFEDIDTTLLKESVTRQETFPVGTHSIGLGNIALGKFLYIKPAKDLQAIINGESITLRGGKASKMWVSVTTLSITTAEIQEVLVFCAGE
jgi:hypothetical protein